MAHTRVANDVEKPMRDKYGCRIRAQYTPYTQPCYMTLLQRWLTHTHQLICPAYTHSHTRMHTAQQRSNGMERTLWSQTKLIHSMNRWILCIMNGYLGAGLCSGTVPITHTHSCRPRHQHQQSAIDCCKTVKCAFRAPPTQHSASTIALMHWV